MDFDFKEAFIVRATNPENNDYIITIGDRIATPQHYKNQKEAEQAIIKKDWNLIASLAITTAEIAINNILNKKEEK